MRLLPCKHYFHAACIDRWFAAREYQQRTCPLCKADPLKGVNLAPSAAAAGPPGARVHPQLAAQANSEVEMTDLRASAAADATRAAARALAEANDELRRSRDETPRGSPREEETPRVEDVDEEAVENGTATAA